MQGSCPFVATIPNKPQKGTILKQAIGDRPQIIRHNKMSLLKTALLAILFGSLYTIFRKYQSVAGIQAASQQFNAATASQQFNQPILQSFIIFVGMSTIALFRPWIKSQPTPKDLLLPPDNKYIYVMPSLLDVFGTIVDTAGLYYTSVSVSQMLKGSVLVFTYLITLFYLKRQLPLAKHIYMALILCSLGLIGLSNTQTQGNKFESNPMLGNGLIIVSQLLFSFMFIYEEKILKQYSVRVENAVFWQGIWGALLSAGVLLAFSIVDTPISPKIFESCILICNNSSLLAAIVLTALSIGPFNYFGISLTKQESALQRCMICTARMIVVWSVSLLFGWEKFRLLQLIGYLVLTYSIFQFNKQESSRQNAELNAEEEANLALETGVQRDTHI